MAPLLAIWLYSFRLYSYNVVGCAGVQAVPWEETVAVTEVRKNDEHDTAAAKRWTSFYTQEIGDIVYRLFESDFKAFGYNRETF